MLKSNSSKRKVLVTIISVALVSSMAVSARAAQEINVFVTASPSSDALKAMGPGFTAKTGIKVNYITVRI